MSSWSEKEASIKALERNGKVDPVDLINAAKDPKHPCHDEFTWDIEKAAEERWRDQARSIIRKCKFEVIIEEMTSPVVRYVPCSDDETVFLSLPKVRSATKTNTILTAELRMLHGLASRVCGIAAAKQDIVGAAVVAELISIRNQVCAVKESLEN